MEGGGGRLNEVAGGEGGGGRLRELAGEMKRSQRKCEEEGKNCRVCMDV